MKRRVRCEEPNEAFVSLSTQMKRGVCFDKSQSVPLPHSPLLSRIYILTLCAPTPHRCLLRQW
jgi:hypothetical protein